MVTKQDFLKYIEEYRWSVIPMRFEKLDNGKYNKRTLGPWKHFQTRRPTIEEVDEWFSNGRQIDGIALVCGKVSRTVVLDIDDPDLDLGLHSPFISQSAFSGGRHYFYKWDEEIGPDVKIDGQPYDYRGDASLAVLPPSSFDDKEYKWLNRNIEDISFLPTLPSEIKEKLHKRKKPTVTNEEPSSDHGIFKKVEEGSRNYSSSIVAGKILASINRSMWEYSGWPTFKKWNRLSCVPPLDEAQLRATWDTCSRGFDIDKFKKEEMWKIEKEMDEFRIIPFNQFPDTWDDEDWILKDFFCKGGLFNLTAYNKTGKTAFLTCMYKAMGDGESEFIGRALTKTKILHISEEFDKQWVKKKYDFKSAYVDIAPRPFNKCKTIEEWEKRLDMILDICKQNGYEMVVFDTLDVFWPVKDENSTETSDAMLGLRKLTEANLCVLVVMHARKGGGVVGEDTRGHSSINDRVDGIISFERLDRNDVTNNKRRITVSNGRFYEEPFSNILDFDSNKKMYTKIAENSWEIKIKAQAEDLLGFISADEDEALSSNGINNKMKDLDFPVYRRDKMTQTLNYLLKEGLLNKKKEKLYMVYWKVLKLPEEVK